MSKHPPLEAAWRAQTNIALIKYWGKRNEELFLPVTSSLSMTLEAFYTETYVKFSPDLQEDQLILDGNQQDARQITRFTNLFRQVAQIDLPVQVLSKNYVPTAAGLASSASAYAALACAINEALGLNFEPRHLSTYTRQGSGSATRSLFGGLVEWHKGHGDDSASSFAEPIDPCDWDIGMLVVMVNQKQKAINSRQGMQLTIETSPFYQLWAEEVAKDLILMKEAIRTRNFNQLGEVAEHNAMKMHATMIAAKPSFSYWEGDSLKAMELVRQLRQSGIPAYFTMDAGPNVKVLIEGKNLKAVQAAFSHSFRLDQLVYSKVGPGPQRIPKERLIHG